MKKFILMSAMLGLFVGSANAGIVRVAAHPVKKAGHVAYSATKKTVKVVGKVLW